MLRRDARPVVVDVNGDEALLARGAHHDRLAVALRVGEEIAEAALERERPHLDVEIALRLDADPRAVALGVGAQIVEHFAQVRRRRRFAGVAAREGEIGLEHAPHLVDVLLQRLDFRRFVDDRERQLEARQDGAQVVADAVEHRRALLRGALDAPLHFDEGVAGLANFARAARMELDVAPLAEILRRLGEAQDRADLVAQEEDGDRDQHDRGAEHPENEDMDVRLVGETAARHEAQNAVAEVARGSPSVPSGRRCRPRRAGALAGRVLRAARGSADRAS